MGLTLATVFGILFAISFLREKRRVRNAIYLLLSLAFLWLAIIDQQGDATSFGRVLSLLMALALPLAVIVESVLFIWHGVTAIRKEGLRLPNVLSILFPIAMWGGFAFYFWVTSQADMVPPAVLYLAILDAILVMYVTFTFVSLLLYSMVYRLLPKRHSFDFIIIHGAGLMPDGTPTPLLAGRCDKAIDIFDQGGRSACIVVSGGQGGDEVVSEARSMRDYLVGRGVPEDSIVLEDQSTTTLENMRNSKTIIDRMATERGITNPTCVFVTSDYHVFRTATYARQVGLKADGVGSRTARYFFPNAFIREYVALMVAHKWPLVIIGVIWGLGVLASSL